MTPEAALTALLAHHRRIAAMEDAAGLLTWDQETQMPPKGAAQRAEARGAVAAALHALRTEPRLGEWIETAMIGDWPEEVRADIREAARDHGRAVRVPDDLAAALARECSAAHVVWAKAKADRRFADFAPALSRVLELKREEGAALADGGDPYDALLDDYEPGAKAADLDVLFGRLRAGLVALLDRLLGAPVKAPRLSGAFPHAAQMALSRRVATACGYDWEAGRLDLAVHPFSSGTGGDVRITTKVNPENPLEALYATFHETGHALYEQGLPPERVGRPAGRHASMGVHESQSRLWENHVGRAAATAPWLLAELHAAFGDVGVATPEALHAAVNALEPGFVRVFADEAQYDLHILMRFDLERALIAGRLAVADLEEAWCDRFEADFGRRPPHAGLGVLQDVHWSEGLFGYFPTYTLGNLAAAALMAALRRQEPGLDAALGTGDFRPVLDWTRHRIHRPGRLRPAAVLLAAACGAPVDEGPLLAHLTAKFGALHGPA